MIGYSFVLTNTGNVTLAGPLAVTDDKANDESCPATSSLAPVASITCTATYTITAGDVAAGSVTNTAVGHAFFNLAVVDSLPASATVTYIPSEFKLFLPMIRR